MTTSLKCNVNVTVYHLKIIFLKENMQKAMALYLCYLPVWATSGKQSVIVNIKPRHVITSIHTKVKLIRSAITTHPHYQMCEFQPVIWPCSFKGHLKA